MLELLGKTELRTVLVLGAHCDDPEIGCGGTLLRLARSFPRAKFIWTTLSSDPVRAKETSRAVSCLLSGIADVELRIDSFRASFFPHDAARIKEIFEALKNTCSPDLILTHYRHDLHQDHRVINELTWNTFRNHLILEYEIPKFDGDLGAPNAFVPLTREDLRQKTDVLMQCFASQLDRKWFTRETFEAIARLRGIECNAPEGFAEAFYVRKARLGF